jgi:capsular polysaccharide biosynthesis protein
MGKPLSIVEACLSCVANQFSIENYGKPPYRYKIKGALYRSDKTLIDHSIRRTGKGDHVLHVDDCPQVNKDELPVLPGRTLYGGHLFHHYGHFISEGLARLWPYLRSDFDNICFYPFIFNNRSNELCSYQLEILSLLGINANKVFIIRDRTLLEEAWVPSSAWPINQAANPVMKNIYSKISLSIDRPSAPTRKIFIARSKKLRASNNDQVQHEFQRLGFEVIYPEMLSFHDQLRLYVETSILAGFSGSGLHNIVFCQPKTKIIEISDERSVSLKRPIPNQRSANSLVDADSLWITH